MPSDGIFRPLSRATLNRMQTIDDDSLRIVERWYKGITGDAELSLLRVDRYSRGDFQAAGLFIYSLQVQTARGVFLMDIPSDNGDANPSVMDVSLHVGLQLSITPSRQPSREDLGHLIEALG